MTSANQIEHYVTLFDSNFLPQGLALHCSMERHLGGGYKLWILCLDDMVYKNLLNLRLNQVSLMRLSDHETQELKNIKAGRTNREYCWTLTPFAPSFVFNVDPDVNRVTYIDADMWFVSNPHKIFSELDNSKKSVLITEHGYASEHDQSATSGKYCVQWVTFCKTTGDDVRAWWAKQCINWCFARFEDGKFGDQKYLEMFPTLFPEKTHILNEIDLLQAPWNSTRFSNENATCWHFHGLRLLTFLFKKRIYYGDYLLPDKVLDLVYEKYIRDLRRAIKLLELHGVSIPNQMSISPKEMLKYALSKYFQVRSLFQVKNLVKM